MISICIWVYWCNIQPWFTTVTQSSVNQSLHEKSYMLNTEFYTIIFTRTRIRYSRDEHLLYDNARAKVSAQNKRWVPLRVAQHSKYRNAFLASLSLFLLSCLMSIVNNQQPLIVVLNSIIQSVLINADRSSSALSFALSSRGACTRESKRDTYIFVALMIGDMYLYMCLSIYLSWISCSIVVPGQVG